MKAKARKAGKAGKGNWRGQRSEVGSQRSENRRQIFSCGSGFPAAILRFERPYDFYGFYDFL
jgi:hypothetical protein